MLASCRHAAFALVLCVASIAAPHGAYPLASGVSQRPGAPTQLVASTNFGALLSVDEGRTWRWLCEEALGYTSVTSSKWLFTASGAIITAGYRGLFISRDLGCSWAAVPEFAQTGAFDVAVDGATVYVSTGLFGVENRVMKSLDDGVTWQAVGYSSSSAYFSSVKLAPSRPQRVYVSQWWHDPPSAVLHRSDDRAAHFEQVAVSAVLPAPSAFTIRAVDPVDPQVLFATVTEDTVERKSYLVRLTEGGSAGAVVITSSSPVTSVAVSPDGTRVFAATADGLYRSLDGGRTFVIAAVPERNACVDSSPQALFVCGWPELDGFALATSDPAGDAGLAPLLRWSQICGAATCPAGSSAASTCAGLFPALEATLPPDLTASVDDPCFVDAGMVVPPAPKPLARCGCASATGLPLSLMVLAMIRRRVPPLAHGLRR